MSEDVSSNSANAGDFHRIARATRFAVACLVFGISYVTARLSLSIPSFEVMLQDMLGDYAKLPVLTTFVLNAHTLLVVLSLCIPVACACTFFTHDIARSIYLLGALALIAIVECIVIFNALSLPLIEIISRMQSGPAQ